MSDEEDCSYRSPFAELSTQMGPSLPHTHTNHNLEHWRQVVKLVKDFPQLNVKGRI